MNGIWLDGFVSRWEKASASVFCHSMQRGSLVFDVASFQAAPDGPIVFRLLSHVRRFLRSAAIVGMKIPFDADALAQGALAAVRSSGEPSGLIRFSAFYPEMEPDLVPASNEARVAMVAASVARRHKHGDGLRLAIARDIHKPPAGVLPPELKAAACYLGPMLARRRAVEAGFDEVVLLDVEGRVAEAPTSNVFAVKRGALFTPPLGTVLDGITRDTVIGLARSDGIEVLEQALYPDDLLGAEEVFLTSTSLPIGGASQVDGASFAGGAPVSRRLERLLSAVLQGDDERYACDSARVT